MVPQQRRHGPSPPPESGGSPRTLLLHAHMFKNAGSTFDWSLRRSLGEQFLDHRDDDAMRAGGEYLASFLRRHPRLRALSSHWLPYPLPRPADMCLRVALFLRDPIERIRSVYEFERRQQPANTPGSRKAKELGFLDYVRWQLQPMPGPVIKNFHTRYCSGNYLGEDPGELFGLAAQRLTATPLLGLVHRYDESMVLFEYLLADDFAGLDLAYVRQNASSMGEDTLQARRSAVEAELAPVLEEVVAANAHDLRLFALAEELFESALSRVPDLPARLRDLQARNRALR